MIRDITVGLIVGASVVLVPAIFLPQAGAQPDPVNVCYEDEPCWDCETMGNHVCGRTPSIADPLDVFPNIPDLVPLSP